MSASRFHLKLSVGEIWNDPLNKVKSSVGEHFNQPSFLRIKLKTLDTIGNFQRPVFSLGVSQHMHKITNL